MEWHSLTMALSGPGLSRESIRGEFNRLGGIGGLYMDFTRRHIRVDYDPGRVTPGEIITSVKAAGYEATLTEPEVEHDGNPT